LDPIILLFVSQGGLSATANSLHVRNNGGGVVSFEVSGVGCTSISNYTFSKISKMKYTVPKYSIRELYNNEN